MWDPQHLTTLQACYGDSYTFLSNNYEIHEIYDLWGKPDNMKCGVLGIRNNMVVSLLVA
jgi:hypothetical protein